MKGLSSRYAEGIVREAMKGALSTGQAAARLNKLNVEGGLAYLLNRIGSTEAPELMPWSDSLPDDLRDSEFLRGHLKTQEPNRHIGLRKTLESHFVEGTDIF